MKILIVVILFCFEMIPLHSQNIVQHFGDLKVFSGGALGLYSHFDNRSPMVLQEGLVGFYGEEMLQISGDFSPVFHDLEIAGSSGVVLATSVEVLNNTNFVAGNIATPRANDAIQLYLPPDSFYTGTSDFSKVDGYVAIANEKDILFPVGNSTHLRMLNLQSEDINPFARCAYFYENPNNTPSNPEKYDTRLKDPSISRISHWEFWKVESFITSAVSVSWNEESQIRLLTDNISELVLVGWHKEQQKWLPLSNEPAVGHLKDGFISSGSFIPNDYDALTFGVLDSATQPQYKATVHRYMVSANGDGINDALVIENLEEYPNNQIQIFNREGLLVYSGKNYQNDFNGMSNSMALIMERNRGVPSGVYFFIIDFLESGIKEQGYFYLSY